MEAVEETAGRPAWNGTQRERAILSCLPLALAAARRHSAAGEPIDDLRQVAALGLVKAARRFDPGRGVPFPAFAALVVDGELRHYLRDVAWPVRLPRRARQQGESVQALSLDQVPGRDDVALEQGELRATLQAGMRSLTSTEQKALVLRYYGDLPQRGIGAALGLSQVGVSRLLERSLGKLRDGLGS